MIVFVVNAGSSTLKCQLIQTDGKACLMKSLAERIGSPAAELTVSFIGSAEEDACKKVFSVAGLSLVQVLDMLFEMLASDEASPVSSLSQIQAIGNRVVSGGEYFSSSELIGEDVLGKIEECCKLAPLHNPPALAAMRLCQERCPDTPQVAVFDTAFHTTMPPKAYMYPLPMHYYDDYRIRRYGAHGTSHRYAAQQAARLLGRPLNDLGIITCHLGSGGSIAAVNQGCSMDTTMGFTPLEGLMMSTRCGSIDPAIVTHIMRRDGIDFNEMEDILNRSSGVLGISGYSGDMREVLEAAEKGDERSDLAIEMYVYKVQKAIGSFFAIMTRTDAVVMTAGVGENSAELRRRIFGGLAHLGMILDNEKNQVIGAIGTNRIISIDDSPIKICVVTTDEEMRIARETDAIVSDCVG